jgi:hypothetical protein
MHVYHGTSTNALDGIVAAQGKLLSKRRMMAANVPMLSGEDTAETTLFTTCLDNDTLYTSVRAPLCVEFARIGFDYAFVRKEHAAYVQIARGLRPSSEHYRQEIEFTRDVLAYVLNCFQVLPYEGKVRALQPQPVLLEMRRGPTFESEVKGENVIFCTAGEIDLHEHLKVLWTSPKGLPKAQAFLEETGIRAQARVGQDLRNKRAGYFSIGRSLALAAYDTRNSSHT